MEPNSSSSITERLLAAQWQRNSHLCIGLDLDCRKLPKGIAPTPRGLLEFGQTIVEATAEFGCCFKPNLAFWSAIGAENELANLFGFIQKCSGLPTILDGKYGDIGNTGEMQVMTALKRFQADAVTVNASLGTDILDPWLNAGLQYLVFALCHTSNPKAAVFQEAIVREEDGTEMAMFRKMARDIMQCQTDKSARLGLVMGATFPKQIGELVDLIPPSTWLLIPAIGKQGAMSWRPSDRPSNSTSWSTSAVPSTTLPTELISLKWRRRKPASIGIKSTKPWPLKPAFLCSVLLVHSFSFPARMPILRGFFYFYILCVTKKYVETQDFVSLRIWYM